MLEFLKSFVHSQLFGIILGAILTSGFTWFCDWLRSRREESKQMPIRFFVSIIM